MNIELSPQERLTKITEILAEGVLSLIMGRQVLDSSETLLRRLKEIWSRTAQITTISRI